MLATSATRAGQIQRNDAAGDGRGEAEREEELTGAAAASRADRLHASPAPPGFSYGSGVGREATAMRPRHSGWDQAAFDQAMAKTAGLFRLRRTRRAVLASYPMRTAASVNKPGAKARKSGYP